MRFVGSFLRFWYDFLVGDDWRIAAGVTAALLAGALLVRGDALSDSAITLLGLAAISVGLIASLALARRGARRQR